MGYQDDYVMRTISDLVRAIARLALGKNEIDYALPDTEDKYSDTDRIYRKLRDLVDAGEINEAENQLYENLDENDTEHLEMALTFYMYLNQLDDDTLFMANYSREEIVEGINSVSASFGITGFENFVDTTMVYIRQQKIIYEITLPFSLASSCPLTADKKLWGLPYEDLAPKAFMKTSFQRTFDSKSSQG